MAIEQLFDEASSRAVPLEREDIERVCAVLSTLTGKELRDFRRDADGAITEHGIRIVTAPASTDRRYIFVNYRNLIDEPLLRELGITVQGGISLSVRSPGSIPEYWAETGGGIYFKRGDGRTSDRPEREFLLLPEGNI